MVFQTVKWLWFFEVIEKSLTLLWSPPRQQLSQTLMLKAHYVLLRECEALGDVL